MKYTLKFSFTTLSICLVGPLLANEIPAYQGEEIVVTATRTPQPASALLNDVTVITREQIAQAGQSSLLEILQAVPGVEITANSGLGSMGSIMLRGANSNHTLILLDGMRLGSATVGLTAIEHIPADLIERIEILPGGASALYGADAVGGVIQIFTKSGKGAPRLNISAGLGSNNLQTFSGGFGGVSGATTFHLQAGYTGSDNFSATNPQVRFNMYNPDSDGYRNQHLSASVEHALNNDHSLGATVFHSDGKIHFDMGPDSNDYTLQTLDSYTVYSRNSLTSAWQSLLRYGYSSDDATTWGMYPSVFHTTQSLVTWQNDIRVGSGTAILGAEYAEQKVSGSTTYSQDRRTISSLLAGYHNTFGPHRVQLNGRRDDNSQFGVQDTGSASYGYRLTEAWKASATIGKSFKAPTFNDLYFPFADYGWGYSYQGNPDLKPEKAFSRELRLSYQQGKQAGGVTYYKNRISNLIIASSGAPADMPTNLGAAEIQGFELSYAGEIAGFKVGANLNLQNPEDEATGLLLPRRAEQHGALRLERRTGAWSLGGETVFSGHRYDDAANTRRLGGYGIVNVYAGYALDKEWVLQARANNLFDRQYELAQGYNTPGANIFVGVRYQPVDRP